jgi:hypothetical protein
LRVGGETIFGAIERGTFANALENVGQGLARRMMKDGASRGEKGKIALGGRPLGPRFADLLVRQKITAGRDRRARAEDFVQRAGDGFRSGERKTIAPHLVFGRHDEDGENTNRVTRERVERKLRFFARDIGMRAREEPAEARVPLLTFNEEYDFGERIGQVIASPCLGNGFATSRAVTSGIGRGRDA